MSDDKISVTLPDPLLRAVRDVAARREISIQQLIRDALATEVARAHRSAKSPGRADERMIAMLRARYANDVAFATSWADLTQRLRRHNVVLRESGGGLILVSIVSGARLCKASDIGASINTLARRFKAPFPGDKQGFRFHYASATHPDETEVIDLAPPGR